MKNGLVVLVFLILNSCVFAQLNGDITLKVEGVLSDQGKVRAALFDSPDGFPDDPEKSVYRISAVADSGSIVLIFRDIPIGEYVMAVFHDENDNGKMDKTEKGIPLESIGISNNPGLKFGPPKYEKSVFFLEENNLELPIILKKYKDRR